MGKRVSKSLVIPALLFTSCAGFAAQPIDLETEPVTVLKSYVSQSTGPTLKRGFNNGPAKSNSDLKEMKRSVDSHGTTHIRMRQMHDGYPVWGTDSVVHVRKSQFGKQSLAALATTPDPTSEMNGTVYKDLDQDLQTAPAALFTQAQADAAKAAAVKLANQQYAKGSPEDVKNELMVYVDENNQAHWSFLTTLYFPVSNDNHVPARPHFILDAQTFQVYKQWNDVEAFKKRRDELTGVKVDDVEGGGIGGNPTAGALVYDGAAHDLAKLQIQRDPAKQTCYLRNSLAEVRDESNSEVLASFSCSKADPGHNKVFWDGKLHEANGGYSPDNDALYAGSIVKDLYKDWYKLDMLTDSNDKTMKLMLMTHTGDNWENAVWDSQQEVIYLGDGASSFYPLTSLGVIAHEVSHGFTQQHSSLIYHDQSGALNEAFSDMAAQTAEFYANGKSSWQIGSEIAKSKGHALRYMDMPSKDCASGHKPGDGCSIDTVGEYADLVASSKKLPAGDNRDSYIVHLASGVFNRAFYLISTADGWDPRKAFDVMIQANSNYWTPTSTFAQAACGVLKATKDQGYKDDAVRDAFKTVEVDVSKCK